jgi:hypothetical protein
LRWVEKLFVKAAREMGKSEEVIEEGAIGVVII